MAVTIDRQGNDAGLAEMSLMNGGIDALAEESRYGDTVIDESIAGVNAGDLLNTHTQSQMQVQSVMAHNVSNFEGTVQH